MPLETERQILMYLPVIHAGYVEFMSRHAGSGEVLILGTGFADAFPEIRKEIRALRPAVAAEQARHVLGPKSRVRVVEPEDVRLAVTARALVIPDEELMRRVVREYALDDGHEIYWKRTFLRWDREWARPQPIAVEDVHEPLHPDEFLLMSRARALQRFSSDWWRQVGAVLELPNGGVLDAYNQHQPTEYSPYLDGDPRNSFHRGERADLTTAIHAEALVIAKAAVDGYQTRNGRLFVTTFPCPSCARLVAAAGITTVFFDAQYAVLQGEHVLKAAGVRLRRAGF